MHHFVSFLFCNHVDGEERTSRFTLIIFLVSCDMLCITLCPFLFCNHVDGEERTSRFTLIIFLMSCDMLCITLCLSCFAIMLMVKREAVVLL